MCRALMILSILLLAGSAWGWRSVMLSQVPSVVTEEPIPATHDHNLKENLAAVITKTEKPALNSRVQATIHDKILGDKSRPYKGFDIWDMVDTIFQPMSNDEEFLRKKPKVKTVVSLTEFVPKHRSPDLFSSFGMKENSLMDDPFFFDISKLVSFMPKLSKIDMFWPVKHRDRNKRMEGTNLTDVEFPLNLSWCQHHTLKRDMNMHDPEFHLNKECRNSVFVKESSTNLPCGAYEEKVTDSIMSAMEKAKLKMSNLDKFLPYIEGALGGVMFVMMVLLIASWRVRKPGTIWSTIPFVDHWQYVEKV